MFRYDSPTESNLAALATAALCHAALLYKALVTESARTCGYFFSTQASTENILNLAGNVLAANVSLPLLLYVVSKSVLHSLVYV